MIEFKAPNAGYKCIIEPKLKVVFLAGSIEQGTAEQWQEHVIQSFSHWPGIILNPRRDIWNSGLNQSIDEPEFAEQVNWELDGLERADFVLFHFDQNTKSPITLLELGLIAPKQKAVVSCGPGFWRAGNVQIVCQRFNVPFFKELDSAIDHLKERI